MKKVNQVRLFALYNPQGQLLSYVPSKNEYIVLYRRYDKLKVWDYFDQENIQHWFKSQPEPRGGYKIQEIPNSHLRKMGYF